ncbi:MAG: DUF2817 domain-containing protein [Bdellovibrionales bacterium]|nr:DUF2817 domain-containing protein [Bdellovibrionales bacterium]
MKSFMFGQSSLGLPILGYQFGNAGPRVLILGGVHGNEWEGIVAAQGLLKRFFESFTYSLDLTIVPVFNPDGAMHGQRKNANGVDLNRNLPTNDWTAEVAKEDYYPGIEPNSEPENQALTRWVQEKKPQLVISLHSWNPLLNVNGGCKPEAEVIASLTRYKIEESIGYPTPGCLGTYCGLERDMPTLTYELQRDMKPKEILNQHVPAILEALKVTEERF